jgi:glucose-1-phosphate adenylyltransferase
VLDSLVSNGCIISGGRVAHSILGPRVFVHSWGQVEDCVVFDEVDIGRHAKVHRAIIDKGVKIPDGEEIGYDLEKDRQRFPVTPNGVVVIPKGTKVERS